MPRTQIQPILAPRAGLNTDTPADLITELEMSDCQNVMSQDGVIRKRFGYSTLGTNYALGSDVVGADQFGLYSGAKHLLCMTPTDLWRYNATAANWQKITRAIEIDTCEANWAAGSGDTVAHDTSVFAEGTGSVKITLAAQRSDGNKLAYQNTDYDPAKDISTYSKIGFWIRSSASLATNALEVVVSETADGAKSGTYIECLATALTANTWTYVELAKTLTECNAVLSVGLYANATIAEGTVIYLDSVRAVKPYTGEDSDFFDTAAIRKTTETEQWFIFSNGVDAIQKWTGSGVAADLAVTFAAGALLAKYVTEFKNHLVLGNTTEVGNSYPQRVRWSDTAKPDDFDNNNASYADLAGDDFITGLIKFRGDYLIIFKERTVWMITATGDSDVFDLSQIIQHTGCPAGRTARNIGTEAFFLGWDDVYAFNGVEARSLTTKRVRNQLMNSIDPEHIARSFAIHFGEYDEYWLFTPKTGSTYPDQVWVYNYRENAWYRHTLAVSMSCHTPYFIDDTRTIGDLVGSIGDQLWRIGDRGFVAYAPSMFLGDVDGNVYVADPGNNNDNTTAVAGWFTTKDFILTGLQARQRCLRLDVYWQGAGLTVAYSIDSGLTWVNLESDLDANNVVARDSIYFRVDCERIRFGFLNNTSDETFQFDKAMLYWQPGGLRL